MLKKLVLDRIGITLSFDAFDISSERVTNVEVRSKVKEMLIELDELKIPLLTVITDSVPACNAARKKLQTQYHNIVFLPCYAHQINLCVSKIFKVSSEFKTPSQQAVYFKNTNNKYFIGKL
ncbi:hypothetical protein GLOIN_2v1884899 [Rhizophagus clarus]|uniref:DUF659 domain-containing protein n=1 Tax=Rhizophagus clarus TaxID=94130 RepID=A0A8H3QK33_9GLOM|nr:hypothetical protein GLOIN_2v1884899 [Rhizophagus clarus]